VPGGHHSSVVATVRDLAELPKAHLHLHLTGSMRRATLVDLADRYGIPVPVGLASAETGEPANLRGWPRFQRLYDVARRVIRGADDLRRIVCEAAEDEAAAGSGWVEIQVTPDPYAALLGGLRPAMDVLLDAAEVAGRLTGVGVAVIVAANRTRHPADAATLARLARAYAGRGVVGFGLSNDERAAPAGAFRVAFRIAREAGLLSVPHAGELCGADAVREAVETLQPDRVGHGVRAAEDPQVLDLLARRGIACEVCPASNVALRVFGAHDEVPLSTLLAAGVDVVLGADDPLLFGSGLVDQYESARHVHGLDDETLAGLAASSVRRSAAPAETRDRLLAGIAGWLQSAGRDPGPVTAPRLPR
jgi:adenosine deaminase